MVQGKRHHLFNREWWTIGRTIKGGLLAAGALALAIIAIVNASDLCSNRLIKPAQEKHFIELNNKINGSKFQHQEKINSQIMYEIIKVQCRQDVTLSDLAKKKADSSFRIDSVRVSQLLRSNQ